MRAIWFGLALVAFLCFGMLPPLLSPPYEPHAYKFFHPVINRQTQEQFYWLSYGFGTLTGICLTRALGMRFPPKKIAGDCRDASGVG